MMFRELIQEDALAGIASPIADIARGLGISTRLLQQVLARRGFRFSDLAREARLYRAAQLLILGRPVGDTALMVGYTTTSTLRAAFRTKFGVSPAEFRYAATLYQQLEWRAKQERSSLAESNYSVYRVRRDRRELADLLDGVTPEGRELLLMHARPLRPRARRSVSPATLRRRYARER